MYDNTPTESCTLMIIIIIVSLSTLVLNSRDRYEKMATEFYAPENTP